MVQSSRADFDFIVIGAGVSGCVLANRLSADPNSRVLLVEAGPPDSNPLISQLGKWTSLFGSEIDWNYSTESEPGLSGRSLKWPRGKTYGGSSAISAAAYVRGHRACFEEWARRVGPSWGFSALLPYFKRLEDNSRGASDYLGAGGPLAVSDTTDPHAGHVAFLEAARTLGFGASPAWDFNGPQQENGAGYYQKNLKGGRRHSVAAAFLSPILTRSNLTVWPNARALRLIANGRRIEEVEIVHAGSTARAHASREVVVAAGVIESPKLLMLSGLGPADELAGLAIPVLEDLPQVGRNLHDHPKVSLRWTARRPLAPSSVSAGLLTHSTAGGASDRAVAGAPDIQFYVGRGLDVVDQFVTLTVALSQPRSRGHVRLRSADSSAAPIVEPNYFAESADLDALVEGAMLAQALAATHAYDALRGAAVDPPNDAATANDLRKFVQRTADTIFHPVGTCRMGSDRDAVVDSHLRVRGIDGLRIADASVMPIVVNCQTLAACLVIAERAAEMMVK